MKFTQGYWMNKAGVTNTDIMQVREVRVEGNKVYLYTLNHQHNGRVLGGPILELYISSPKRDIIRIEAFHFMGSGRNHPSFELDIEDYPILVVDNDKCLTITSGDTMLLIDKNPCNFTFYYKNKRLTSIGNRYGSVMLSSLSTDSGSFMRAQLELDIGEKVYGLGEQFTPFVKNGQSIDIWNEDGGTCTNIAYKNVPFYITNRGYGVFVNDAGPVSYEICSEHVTRAQFSVPGEKLDFMVIGGGDMKSVLQNYTNLVGKPALPPAWTFGLWLTSSFTTSYDENTVMSFVDGMAKRQIPLSVFHFDCFWMKENEWCNFTWDKNVFPDVEGMLSRMKSKGLKICVWINPYIGQKSPLFKEAMELGYLLTKPNGDVWQTDLWQAGMSIIDFTNPCAYKWYQDKLRGLLVQGVDCFKTDFGERIPTDVVYHNGKDPLRMHNFYSYLYNKCVFELLEEYKGKNEAILFARSATAGCQKFPVHWGGDCNSNYSSMAESLRGGLSLCLSGFGFWSHDISGFEGTAPAHIYKRWAAFGLLSTHSRLHGSDSYRVPWLFCKDGEENGEESVAVVKAFAELKCTLMPYIFASAVYSSKYGIPVMRPMILEFPNDIICEDLDRQYMLGDNLMVAPVFRENGDVSYYLPSGKWTHFLSGKVMHGGQWIQENYDFFSLPLFARENSIIPVGQNNQTPEYDYNKGLTLHIFQLTHKAETTVCNSKGEEVLKAYATNNEGKIQINLCGKFENLKICMRNINSFSVVNGATAELTSQGVLLHVSNNTVEFS